MAETSSYPRMTSSESVDPDLVARARQSPGSETWVTIGLAWAVTDESGNAGFAVRLHAAPTHWDGNFFLMPPV